MKLELVATATFGLEAVVRREIEALGYKVIKTEDGRVTYMGDERAIVRSNLWLRTADRVYVRMGEFSATEFEDLFQQTKALEWESIIPLEGVFPVVGGSVTGLSEDNKKGSLGEAVRVLLQGNDAGDRRRVPDKVHCP